MKRRLLTAIMMIGMSVFWLTGCGEKEDTTWKKNDSGADMDWFGRDDEPTEIPTEAPVFDFGNDIETNNAEGGMEEVTTEQEATWVQFTHYIDSNEPVESAIVTGYDDDAQVVWTYETGNYDMTELERVVEIGVFEDRYYLLEGGSIVALRVSDGEVLWTNSEFCGASPCFDFMENGFLFISGYYGPDLFGVDKDGNTLVRIECFDTNYYWPCELKEENGSVQIRMQGGYEDGDIICNVVVGDYENYYFTDVYGNLIGEEIIPGVDPGDMDITEWIVLTPTEVCEQVAAYYNAYFGTTDFVVFDTEYATTAEGIWVVLRTTGRADANVYVADVFVNMVTGEVTDPWGENWYLTY